MSILECHAVTVRYPTQRVASLKQWVIGAMTARHEPEVFEALQGVSFTIEEGESVGVIGANGAGKSTLLRVAGGIIQPSEGYARTEGTVAPLIELGTGFDGELSGRENIFFNGSLLGRTKRQMQARMDEIIAFADIGAFIDAPLRTYSTGMVARLAFAIATAIDADLLLLDEILSVGDASFRERCDERIRAFATSGKAMLLVSHDLESIAALCPKTLWMANGRVVANGPTPEIVEAYVASLHAPAE